jgi:hypothetical protein
MICSEIIDLHNLCLLIFSIGAILIGPTFRSAKQSVSDELNRAVKLLDHYNSIQTSLAPATAFWLLQNGLEGGGIAFLEPKLAVQPIRRRMPTAEPMKGRD